MEPEHTFLESDDEFEGVGAHPDNPRYDHATAMADVEAGKADAQRLIDQADDTY